MNLESIKFYPTLIFVTDNLDRVKSESYSIFDKC